MDDDEIDSVIRALQLLVAICGHTEIFDPLDVLKFFSGILFALFISFLILLCDEKYFEFLVRYCFNCA